MMLEDEEILWEGKPKQGFQLVFEDLLIMPFLIIFVIISYIIANGQNNVILFFISFFFFLGIIYYRYISDIIARKSESYQITSGRVIIKKSSQEIILPFNSIKQFSFKEHPFSYTYGSVIFGEEQNIFGPNDVPFSMGRRGGLNLERDKVAIDFIKDYKEVYNLIKQKIEEANLNL